MAEGGCCAGKKCHPRAILTVLGGFLVHMTLSTTYVFGNIIPYVTSYLRERSDTYNASYTQTIWISTTQALSMASSMPLLGLIEQRISPRFCALAGAWIYSLGMLLTYFTVKKSLGLTILTYGVIHGIGKGMAYPSAVKCGLAWFPEKKGLVTGLIIAGIGGGTFAFNEVITHFINPDNLLPEKVSEKDLYFNQDVLLDRVPYCFLMLGGIYAGIQLIAVLMIGQPAAPSKTKLSEENKDKELSSAFQTGDETKTNEPEDTVKIEVIEKKKTDFSPLEVLRTKIIYLLWVIYVCVVLGIFFVSNFYKTFSQMFIKDDHFLAMAGSVSSVLNALGRPFWGAVGDRVGYRESLVIILVIFGSAAVTFNLCEYGGKPMLMIWMCLIYGTFSGFYCIMPSLVATLFGQKYYSSNYGILFTAMIVAQVVGALLASQLKKAIGWKGILYIGAGGVLFSLLLSIGMMIHHRRRARRRQQQLES